MEGTRALHWGHVTSPHTKATVLVVEDDAALRNLYRTALTVAGYTVEAVEDGFDALQRIERHRPDAMILDLALPRLGGRDVHREVKSRPETRDLPVVVVTGTDTSDLDESDFECVLKKPVPPEKVGYALEKCLRQARSPRS